MLINGIYEVVNVLLNKDQRGKISPFEFNNIAVQGVRKVTDELLSEYKKLVLRKNRFTLGAGLANQAHFNVQAIEYYLMQKDITVVNGSADLGNDIWFLSEAYSDNSLIEKVENTTYNTLKRSNTMRPNTCMPICTMMGNSLKVFPNQSKIEIHYLRKPKDPQWNYQMVNGVAIFDGDTSKDFDVHYSLVSDLVIEILGMCGINLREQEIEQYVAQLKQEAIAKQNTM